MPAINTYMLDLEFFRSNKDSEFFFGIWNPYQHKICVDCSEINVDNYDFSCGNSFFLMSSVFLTTTCRNSLLHTSSHTSSNGLLAFRGYVLDPPIHTLSDSDQLTSYWSGNLFHKHNGVFAAATIDPEQNSLQLITDALGIGALYYRKIGTSIAFATSPRFLSSELDSQDLVAWRCLMQSSFLPGDFTLTSEIKRVPPGSVMSFCHDKIDCRQWFDFSGLPDGSRPIFTDDVDIVEQAFESAMSRCLELDLEKNYLPLSSGYDSRRILAHFLTHQIDFSSGTICRLDPLGREVDGYFSERMSKEFSFRHETFGLISPDEMMVLNERRRFLLDYESRMHAWYLPLWREADQGTLLFEGLCGDTLGHSGLKISGVGRDYVADHEWIVDRMIKPTFNSVLNPTIWPDNNQVKDTFFNAISFLPKSQTLIDLVVMLHRARRAISVSSQQFARPGHVVVYPFLDLDYVRTLLQYSPMERFNHSMQSRCLEKFHPQIFSYPGSHFVPENLPVLAHLNKNNKIKALKNTLNDIGHLSVDPYLTTRRHTHYKLVDSTKGFLTGLDSWSKPGWWLTPFSEFILRKNRTTYAFKIEH